MKIFALLLHFCNGFTYSRTQVFVERTVGGPCPSTAPKMNNIHEQEETSTNKLPIASVVAAALAWAVGTSPSLASPPIVLTTTSGGGGSSSLVVAAEYSNSDFTDFSLPSYQETLSAEPNTNLKGGKQLFGEGVSGALPTR